MNVNTGADLSKGKFNLLFITFTNMDATHSSKEKSNLLSSKGLLPRNAAAEKEVKRIWDEKVLWARSFTLHNLQIVNYPIYFFSRFLISYIEQKSPKRKIDIIMKISFLQRKLFWSLWKCSNSQIRLTFSQTLPPAAEMKEKKFRHYEHKNILN